MSWPVNIDQQQLAEVKDTLSYIKNGSNRALMRASNVGAARAKAETGRQLKALLTAPAKKITDSLRVSKRATLNDTTAKFASEGKPIELINFDHGGSMYSSEEGGIMVEIFKAGGNPLRLKHGFIAKMKSGHINIWTRKNPFTKKVSGRLPIYKHYGPNAAEALEKSPGALQAVLNYAIDKYLVELDRQVDLLFLKEYGIEPPEDFF